MNFKKKYEKAKGYTPICRIGECSLKKLEFGIIELEAGETVEYNTEDKTEELVGRIENGKLHNLSYNEACDVYHKNRNDKNCDKSHNF